MAANTITWPAAFPTTVGAVFAPILAAVGAITALATDCSIEVEREVEAEDAAGTPPTDPAEAPIG
jgi:hypothetical protein